MRRHAHTGWLFVAAIPLFLLVAQLSEERKLHAVDGSCGTAIAPWPPSGSRYVWTAELSLRSERIDDAQAALFSQMCQDWIDDRRSVAAQMGAVALLALGIARWRRDRGDQHPHRASPEPGVDGLGGSGG